MLDLSNVPLISADAHVEEPHDLWWDNLPASMRDEAPRMIQATGDGGWDVVINGEPRGWGSAELERIQNLDADRRVQVMLSDGIAGECIFPTIGLYIWNLRSPDVGARCCRVYNEWVDDLLESRSPRFRCAGLLPTWDVDEAVREARLIAEAGLGSAMLPLVGSPPYNDPQWEPLWCVLEEAGLPVVMHQGTGHDMVFYRGAGAAVANLLATQSMAPRAAGLLVMSGVLERHPNLHFVFVEVNAGWMAWAMATLDYYREALGQYGWVRPELSARPSEYLARQLHATFQDDPVAIANVPTTGVEPLLWGSDYPHDEGTYPHSRETVQRLCGDLDISDAQRILGGTTAELFNFDTSLLHPVRDAER